MAETTRTGPVREAAGRAGESARKATQKTQETAGKAAQTGQQAAERGQELVPTGELASALQGVMAAVAERALSSVTHRVERMTGRLTDFAEGGGGNLLNAITGSDKAPGSVMAGAATGAVKGAAKGLLGKIFKGGKGKGGGGKLKVTNIVEWIDVGAPRRIVYNQWTQFKEFPTFMKKVENIEQESDEKLSWKAQVWWSHRTWKSTILEQMPDERIIWRSEGAKGHVDGAVSFHELAPDLTRVAVVLEYHPQGFFERTGNLWRAQGRRARLELKHFARHVMSQSMLHPDELEEGGWRGEIHDGQVVKDHESAVSEERDQQEQQGREGQEERGEREPSDEYEGEEEFEYEGDYEGEEEPEEEPEEERGARDERGREDEGERAEGRAERPARRRAGAGARGR